jgi:outer membrane protein assembly factor BamB
VLRAALAVALATALAAAQDWPQWRGPSGDGIAPDQRAPLTWDRENNVKWRTPLARPGNGSPIVVGGRVFLTMAEDEDGKGRSLYCFDREDGKQLWVRTVAFDRIMPTHATNPHCSSTPASDGQRVVVWHASAGLWCYDLDGEELWHHDLGEFLHQWGYGTSPVVAGDRVVLHTGPGERTFVLAFRLADGEELWRTEEPSTLTEEQIEKKRLVGSWCTPFVHRAGDRTLVLCGQPTRIVAYDLDDGAIVWWCEGITCERGDLTYSSPVVAGDVCFVLGGYDGPSLGVRLDGEGDVTKSHRLWRHPDQQSNCGSGVFVNGSIFVPDMGGFMICIDPKDGTTRWRTRIGRGNTWGSVVSADGRLYVTNQRGTTIVFEPNPVELVVLAENALDETTNSTPAVADGELFVRTHSGLYCIAAATR